MTPEQEGLLQKASDSLGTAQVLVELSSGNTSHGGPFYVHHRPRLGLPASMTVLPHLTLRGSIESAQVESRMHTHVALNLTDNLLGLRTQVVRYICIPWFAETP